MGCGVTGYALEGQEVTRVCLDFAVIVETSDGTELRFETAFNVTHPPDGASARVDPEAMAESVGAVVSLLHRRVASADVGDDGLLVLLFDRGSRLECGPHDDFEAWSLVTAAGERVVCLPGGGIAHWPPGGGVGENGSSRC